MERITGHYDKIVLTLIMCLVILLVATFSPFAESANAIAVTGTAIVAIVIAALSAVGITFVTTGAFDNLNDYVADLMGQYAISQGTTVESQLSGVQVGSDKLGRLLVNNKFLIYLQGFASFLKATYNLVNNSSVILEQPGTSIGSITVYPMPATGKFDSGGKSYSSVIQTYVNGEPVFDIYLTWVDQPYKPMFITKTDYANNAVTARVTCDALHIDLSMVISNWSDTVNGYSIGTWENYWVNNGNFWAPSYAPIYTESQVIAALYANPWEDVNETSIVINTDNMVLPLDDDNYTDGDGAIIDVDADWGDSYIDITEEVIPDAFSDSKEGDATIEYTAEDEVAEQVEQTSEITNLPGGAIPFVPLALPSFSLVSIWHYVQQWIEDTAIAAGTLMNLVGQAPHPMVNMFYAITCLAIIFGFIKGLAK